MTIYKGDLVLHTLSKLYFICENNQQAKWMNMNRYYQWVPSDTVPKSYHAKN